MNSKKVILSYTLLTLFLLASAVVFAYQIKAYMRDRGYDPTLALIQAEDREEDVIEQLETERQLDQKEVMIAFGQNTSFSALATPIPMPTATPRPLPSPTPVIPAKNYKVNFVMGESVSIKDYTNKDHIVKVGDVIKEPVHGDFEIVEIFKDMMNPRVKVKHVASGTVRIFGKDGN